MIETTNKKQELKKFQLLLDGPDKEYVDFGKLIAPNSKLIQRENDLGELIQQEGLADKNKTVVLNRKEIKSEMIKYNLTIVSIENYKGDFDISYLKSVKEFIKEKNLSVSDYDLKKKLHCLYPKLNFKFIDENNTIGDSTLVYNTYKYDGNKEKNPTILFEENGFYHLVHKGTNYKTLYNLRRGLLNYSIFNNVIIRVLSILVLIGLIIILPFKINEITGFFIFLVYIVYNGFFTMFDCNTKLNQYNKKIFDKWK